ncbi:uncharacterized protein LOC135813407 [Sycon ciliatum]|uniref:uncharacterized protein LOC135813407 n=1 Tax=Sycon ciliatum TaxID=27933 RepID=UPI0031F6BFD5
MSTPTASAQQAVDAATGDQATADTNVPVSRGRSTLSDQVRPSQPADVPLDQPVVQQSSVTIKLSPFWPKDSQLWFAQAEAVFATRKITRQLTKFQYVIGALEPEYAIEIRDMIISPPDDRPYEQLRDTLVRQTQQSQQQRLRHLLTEEVLGDRKPSQLLRRMQQLLGSADIDTSLLRELFIQRLPAGVQMVLASSGDSMSLDKIADMADRILEVSAPHATATVAAATVAAAPVASAPAANVPRSELDDLRCQIANLTAAVQQLSRSRLSSRHGSRTSSRDSSPSRDGLCFYHRRFGDRALHCRPGCQYQSGNGTARN